MASPSDSKAEPFPALSPIESVPTEQDPSQKPLPRSNTQASRDGVPSSRGRAASIRQSFMNSCPPLGVWHATGEVASKVPTLAEIKNGSFSAEGWNHEGQLEKRGANPHDIHRRRVARTSSASMRTRASSNAPTTPISPTIDERQSEDHGEVRQYFPRRGSLAVKTVQEEGEADEKAGAIVTDGDAQVQNDETVPAATNPVGIPSILPQPPRGIRNVSVFKPVDTSSSEKTPASSIRPAAKAAAASTPSPTEESSTPALVAHPDPIPDQTGTYPNGYRFPKKHTWMQSTAIGLKALGKFFITPLGFFVTIYALNVVGWGAMIFFLLLNAAPALCNPSCTDKRTSARQIWIEIDSQVLNGLFCVTAWGLLPWRARDMYFLMRWRVWKDYSAHRRLAGYYRGWYRLPGSQDLPDDVAPPPVYTKKHPQTVDGPPPYSLSEIQELEKNDAIPLPVTSMPDPPLTGARATTTRSWALDWVIWNYMWNTILQCFLAGIMWGYNRYTRSSAAVGALITLGCLTGISAGVMVGVEGSKVKKVEGIPVMEYDVLETEKDFQERKAKEDQKLHKKESKHERRVKRTEKVKGHAWFTRS